MKIILVSVGKANEAYVQEGVKEFTSRINRYYPVEWQIIPSPKNAHLLSPELMKKKEAELILEQVKKEDYLVALDERGKLIGSEELSRMITERAMESRKNMIFVIGGAYGLDETVIRRADFIFSLSKLTFPHQLVRLILAEQVYRACTIERNEKYHHA